MTDDALKRWICLGCGFYCDEAPISLKSIAGTVGLPPDGDRFAWVQAYFAAKRRQFQAAGYPPDCGGLMQPVTVR